MKFVQHGLSTTTYSYIEKLKCNIHEICIQSMQEKVMVEDKYALTMLQYEHPNDRS